MTKEEKKEQKLIRRENRKKEIAELEHQRFLKHKKFKDTKIDQKEKYGKKVQSLNSEYDSQVAQTKSRYKDQLNHSLEEAKTKFLSSPKDQASKQAYALEAQNIKQNNAKELNAVLEKLWNIHDENLFVAKISMQYEIAKNRISEKEQKKAKMKVDKSCAFRVYKKKLEIADKIYNENVDKISQEYKAKYKEYRKTLSEFKSQNKNKTKSNEYKAKFEQLRTEYVNINLEYETKIINNKIMYKNTCAQLLHECDLSYDNELDTSFKIKRWWYGVGKEFQRMSWPTAGKTFRDFGIIIAVSLFIAAIFALIDFISTFI